MDFGARGFLQLGTSAGGAVGIGIGAWGMQEPAALPELRNVPLHSGKTRTCCTERAAGLARAMKGGKCEEMFLFGTAVQPRCACSSRES